MELERAVTLHRLGRTEEAKKGYKQVCSCLEGAAGLQAEWSSTFCVCVCYV